MTYVRVNFQDGITPLNAEQLNKLDAAILALDSAPPPDLSGYQLRSEEGQPNGYAALDGTGKVPSSQLNVAPLPARLGATATAVSNWNTAVDNGWYYSSPGGTNAPEATGWYLGEVIAYSATGWVDQVVWLFTGGLNRWRYRRQMNGTGTWSAWISDPICYRGAYAGGTSYAAGDVVLYGGRYWMSISNNVNVIPA